MKHTTLLLLVFIVTAFTNVTKAQHNLCDLSLFSRSFFEDWICGEIIDQGRDTVPMSFTAIDNRINANSNLHLITFDPDPNAVNMLLEVATFNFDLTEPPPIVVILDGLCDQANVLHVEQLIRLEPVSFKIPVSNGEIYLAYINTPEGEASTFCYIETFPDCDRAYELNEVSSSCDNSQIGGPYCPGETVEFCIDINSFPFTQTQCSFLQGIVPYFGEGWDPASFNMAGQPDITIPITAIGDGIWSWYEEDQVEYNYRNFDLAINDNMHGAYLCSQLVVSCGDALDEGTELPAGWYAWSPDGALPDGHPNNSFGDGLASCDGTGNWTLCFTLTARSDEMELQDPDLRDASVGFTILSDNEIGTREGEDCMTDLSFTFEASICPQSPQLPLDLSTAVCSGTSETFIIPNPDNNVFSWTFSTNSNITGAAIGQGTQIDLDLSSNSSQIEEIQYFISAQTDTSCFISTLTVRVIPEIEGLFNQSIEACDKNDIIINIPTQITVNNVSSPTLNTQIVNDNLIIRQPLVTGLVFIDYLNTCANENYIDTIMVQVVDTVDYLEELVLCIGDASPFNSLPITSDTTYIIRGNINGCPARTIYMVAVESFGLPADTVIRNQDTLILNARTFSNLPASSLIRWITPNGDVFLTDQLTVTEAGVYTIYSNSCGVPYEIIVFDCIVADLSANVIDCEEAVLSVVVDDSTLYSYNWNTGDTTSSISVSETANYSVTITDAVNNCSISLVTLVEFPDTCRQVIYGQTFFQFADTCGSPSPKMPLVNHRIFIEPTQEIIQADQQGNFSISLGQGTYTISPIIDQFFFESCPTSQTIEINSDSVFQDTILFCLLNNTECAIDIRSTSEIVRPDQHILFSTAVRNDGGQTINNLTLTGLFDNAYDVSMAGVSEIYPIDEIIDTEQKIRWNIFALAPGETVIVKVSIRVSDLITRNDILENSFTTQLPCLDSFVLKQEVRTSFDPNDKILRNVVGRLGNNILRSDTTLNYTIRFQNTGNDTAFRVVISDQLSESFDLLSFIPGPSSHDFTWIVREDRTVEFIFDPIALPYQSINDEGSQGFVSFSIDRDMNVALGDTITNEAAIFFDLNAPVITNTVANTYTRPQYTISSAFALCPGDEYMGIPIYVDTIITRVIPFYDFDSVYRDELFVFSLNTTEIDTSILGGQILFGNIITQDTTITLTFLDQQNGCDSFVVYNVEAISGAIDAEPQVLNIFPNPTTGDLTISCEQAILSIQFYDMQGQLVLDHLNVDQTERRLNLDQFNSGVYSILFQTTRGVINERVVVMKD